ncbi:rod shape-determining protein MreC [Nonomuraea sp. SYSU D8015]|uniref:rod shape-determining protein MreC n=1 Tax=Nonomuraea sp. SYSU D8015 TaxID=2593644 RepID=UPI0016607DE5|nr:rod shape-determining protein MreC [Nonomuraea sp. SYSU D8015]
MRALHRHRRVLALLVGAAALLITLDLRGDASALRSAVAAATGPAEQLLAAAWRPVATLAGAGDARRRAEEAERRSARLAAELWAERAARASDAQRHRIRAAHPRLTLVPAQVVAVRGDSVTIDAGTRAGVGPDMAVVTAEGLVGRVVAAGPAVATVLLATAPSAAAGVRVAESREIGTVEGRRDGLLTLRLLDADAELRPGQQVETLGSSGARPYPAGVPVGTVERVDPAREQFTRTALVRPAVTFSTLDVVGVIADAG